MTQEVTGSRADNLQDDQPDSHHSKAHENLDKTLFHGIAWTAVFRWIAQFVSWGIMLYVARILSPDDFGIVAMAAIPIGLARLVEDIGLDAVIVQNRKLTEEQLAQLGGFALIVGIVITVIFLLLAAPIANFFEEPAVSGLIMILSITFILDALQILPRALLQRDLAFRRLAWINALQMVVTSAALGMYATFGFSYWSLALNAITGTIVITIILLWLRPHRLALPRHFKSLVPSLWSGSHLLVSRISWYGYSNIDQTIIGKFLGKTDLGVYSFSMTFARVPLDEVVSLVGKVVPGIFSTVQNEKDKLRRYFLILTEALSYLTFPMAIGLMLTADDFVMLALGDQWEAVIAPLQILCAYTVMHSSQSLISHVFLWTGHFKLNMWLNIFALIVLPIGFYIGTFWGLPGVALGWTIAFPISLIPAFYFACKILDMRITQWVMVLLPALSACLVMVGAVIFTRLQLEADGPYWYRLAIQSGIGALAYTTIILAFYRHRLYAIWQAIRGRAHISELS